MNNTKNTSWHRKRHTVIQKIAYPFMKCYLKIKEGFVTDVRKDLPKGPALIISNHLSDFDPFKIGLNIKETAYYVSTDDIFNKKAVGNLIKFVVNPIPKSKSVSDIKCVRTIIKVIKEGYKVVLFPEGNRSYSGALCNVDPSIAKLCEKMNVPIIIFNMIGSYSSNPRWGRKIRKSENRCVLKRIITPEEIKAMGTDRLYNEIIENITTPVETFAKKENKRIAEYLERCLFYCPNCNKFETIYSHKKEVHCLSCGYNLRYNKDLSFSLIKGEKEIHTVEEWYNLEFDAIRKFNPFNDDNIIFEDFKVNLYNVVKFKGKKKLIKRGHMTITNKEIKVESKNKTVSIPIEKIFSSCCVMKNKGNFYVDDYMYQVKGQVRFSALKYVTLVHRIQNITKDETGENEFLGI